LQNVIKFWNNFFFYLILFTVLRIKITWVLRSLQRTVREFLTKKRIPMIDHPSYSLGSIYCFLFLKLKISMKETHCDDIPIIEAAVTRILKVITKADLHKFLLLVDRAVLKSKNGILHHLSITLLGIISVANFIKKVAEVDLF